MEKMSLALFLTYTITLLIGCQSDNMVSKKVEPENIIENPQTIKKAKVRPIEEVKETFDGRLYRIYNAPPIEYNGSK